MKTEDRIGIELTGINLLASYFIDKAKRTNDIGLFEFGIDDKCRFDCIIFNGMHRKIKGYEFKINRSDFLTEIRTGKWKRYLTYCHTFSFVCPKGLIDKNEVPSKIGLLWITTANEYYGYDRDWDRPKGLWIKYPKFLGEISEDRFQKIALTLIGRVKYRKDDFF